MTKAEYLEGIKTLEGEALFRQTMHWLSVEEIADHTLAFSTGAMQSSEPVLTLHFLDADGDDAGDTVALLLPGSAALIEE